MARRLSRPAPRSTAMVQAELESVERRASALASEIMLLEQRLTAMQTSKRRAADAAPALPPQPSNPRAAADAAPPLVRRRYSTRSQAAMDDLAVYAQHADALQRASAQLEAELQRAERVGELETTDPALRNELAQLYGDATTLVDRGLDGLATGELVSGQADARATRKKLVQRLEGLAEAAKAQIARYDRLANHDATKIDALVEEAEDID